MSGKAKAITEVMRAMNTFPDLRIGQLIVNAATIQKCDPFCISNEELAESLERMVETGFAPKEFVVSGMYDTEGNYHTFAESVEVVRFGDSLRDRDSGVVWAVLDEYGDWVSPILRRFGKGAVVNVETA